MPMVEGEKKSAPIRNATQHAADRLLHAIDKHEAPVCVGLDPVLDRLPTSLRSESSGAEVDAIREFVSGVLHSVYEHAPCVKFQSACFERYGAPGVAAVQDLIGEAKTLELEVILDAKRGDIGISAAHYAAAAFESSAAADWLTINGYLGRDTIEPFLVDGCGAFVLVRTSNPGGDAFQEQGLKSGDTIAEAMAKLVAETGENCVGQSGYSALGAVVGATKPEAAKRLRELMPRQIFLVPGFGAQGGGVDDVLPCFNDDGRGAIVTASRSVIYAFDDNEKDWRSSVERAAESLAEQVGAAVGLR